MHMQVLMSEEMTTQYHEADEAAPFCLISEMLTTLCFVLVLPGHRKASAKAALIIQGRGPDWGKSNL